MTATLHVSFSSEESPHFHLWDRPKRNSNSKQQQQHNLIIIFAPHPQSTFLHSRPLILRCWVLPKGRLLNRRQGGTFIPELGCQSSEGDCEWWWWLWDNVETRQSNRTSGSIIWIQQKLQNERNSKRRRRGAPFKWFGFHVEALI